MCAFQHSLLHTTWCESGKLVYASLPVDCARRSRTSNSHRYWRSCSFVSGRSFTRHENRKWKRRRRRKLFALKSVRTKRKDAYKSVRERIKNKRGRSKACGPIRISMKWWDLVYQKWSRINKARCKTLLQLSGTEQKRDHLAPLTSRRQAHGSKTTTDRHKGNSLTY